MGEGIAVRSSVRFQESGVCRENDRTHDMQGGQNFAMKIPSVDIKACLDCFFGSRRMVGLTNYGRWTRETECFD